MVVCLAIARCPRWKLLHLSAIVSFSDRRQEYRTPNSRQKLKMYDDIMKEALELTRRNEEQKKQREDAVKRGEVIHLNNDTAVPEQPHVSALVGGDGSAKKTTATKKKTEKDGGNLAPKVGTNVTVLIQSGYKGKGLEIDCPYIQWTGGQAALIQGVGIERRPHSRPSIISRSSYVAFPITSKINSETVRLLLGL